MNSSRNGISRFRTKLVPKMAVLTLAIATSQFAAAVEPGFYIGASGGNSNASIEKRDLVSGLTDGGFTDVTSMQDDTDSGYKYFGGLQFNPFFALELGYFDLGEFSFDTEMLPLATTHRDLTVDGVTSLDLVGMVPLGSRFSAFARAGVINSRSIGRFSGTGFAALPETKTENLDTSFKIGLGVEVALTSALSFRAEAERYRIDEASGTLGDVDLYSLGLVYRFGQRNQIAAAPAPTPAPTPDRVAPAPTPQPAPVAVAPTPVRVALSADSLFDFDSSTIKPAGMQELDRMIADLRGVEFDQIHVIGHTDRVGVVAYNQSLSQRRADAVKDYLLSHSTFQTARITSEGVGSAQPVTRASDCPASMAWSERTLCLAPDRRVEVEVQGTRPR